MAQHVCSVCFGSNQCIILQYNEQTCLSLNKCVKTGTVQQGREVLFAQISERLHFITLVMGYII